MNENEKDILESIIDSIVLLILGTIFITSCTKIALENEKTSQIKTKTMSSSAKYTVSKE